MLNMNKMMPHHWCNIIICALLVFYIIFINTSYHQGKRGMLNHLVMLFENPVFCFLVLVFIAYSALEFTPCCGFMCALLLTVAFLNTKMVLNNHMVNEGFLKKAYKDMILIEEHPATMLDRLTAFELPAIDKWGNLKNA